MTDVIESPIVILSSGHSVTIDEVMLYPQTDVAKLVALRAEATKLLGGTSSGIGFIGSPTWAIGGALAVGFLESLTSGSMKRQAQTILQDATELHARLINSGRFFGHTEVHGFQLPSPQGWSARLVESVSVTVPGKEVRMGVFSFTRTEDQERVEEHATAFIYFEQEFMQIRNSAGAMHIKWADVSAFRAGKSPRKPSAEPTGYMTNAELAALKRRQFTDPSYSESR